MTAETLGLWLGGPVSLLILLYLLAALLRPDRF